MKKIFAAVLFVSLFTLINVAYSAPKKDLWIRWQVTNPLSTKTIDYREWADFLKRYVHADSNGINLVAYSQVSDSEKLALQQFIRRMSQIQIDNYNRKEQEAYWINLYNALTIDIILRHYPVKKIKNIKMSGLFTRGPWDAKVIKVEDVSLSLNDIEQRILRPIWNDQRLHYVLNCATMGCLNLPNKPFEAKTLNDQLNKATVIFINNKENVKFQGKKLIISAIYRWYKTDFGGTDDDVIDWMEIYANHVLRNKLKFTKKIGGYEYNWVINAWPIDKKLPILKKKKHKR